MLVSETVASIQVASDVKAAIPSVLFMPRQSLSLERTGGHVLVCPRSFSPYSIIFPLPTVTWPFCVLCASSYSAVIVKFETG